MRLLVYGAGVIGSIFGGRLSKSGHDVTMLARGARYEEIKSNGVVLRNGLTGKTESVQVNCIKELLAGNIYDFIIVAVQNGQIDAILPVLRDNTSKNLVFVVNNPLGYSKYIEYVGRERVMLGFPSAGGERKDGVVTYFIGTGIAKAMQATTFAELDGSRSHRLLALVKVFKKAKFEPSISKNMDAWQKTHIAFVIPIAKALAKYDCDNRKLAKSRPTINIMIQATREGFSAIKEGGYSIEPKKLYFYYMPKWILCSLFQILFSTRIAEFSMAKHSCAAKEEIRVLEEEFLSLFRYNSFYHWNRLN